jgi:hypothetical protein
MVAPDSAKRQMRNDEERVLHREMKLTENTFGKIDRSADALQEKSLTFLIKSSVLSEKWQTE